MPRFEGGLSHINVKRAAETLQRLQYHGPLALSWDDTDLEKALSVWQRSKSELVVLGLADGPITVRSEKEVDDMFADMGKLRLGEKVRLVWYNHDIQF